MRYDHSTLGEICHFIDYRGKTPEKTTSGIPLITAKIIKNGFIQPPEEFIATDAYDKWMRRGIPKRGSVIMTTEAPLGEVARIDSDDKLAFAQRIIILEPDETKLDSQYLYYAMRDSVLMGRIKERATGTTVTGIKAAELRKVIIDYPSLQTQRQIAEMVGHIDQKIQNNTRISDNLYEMVSVLYASLFGDSVHQITTVGQYSEQIYSGGTPSTSKPEFWGGDLHWFSSGETRNRFAITTEKTITNAGVDNSSTKLAHKYDIVMASAGQGFTRGQTTMLLLDTYVNQSVIVIHADRLHLPYLFWNLANRYEELRAISDSSSIRGSLTTKMIASFEIAEATPQALQDFSNFAWSVIPEIEKNLLENERLTALRDALLPRLMSGEIDVSNVTI